jgi:uncharacterized membrane protein
MTLRKPLWHRHPHVRSGDQLSVGERAADVLKRAFGSWTFMISLNGFILCWVLLNSIGIVHFDVYPYIALNLVLSWLAAQQGGALQIAANRGDRISSEVAMSTHDNGEKILNISTQVLALNQQQMTLLTELRELRALVNTVVDDDKPEPSETS